jgi:hypothetical protein
LPADYTFTAADAGVHTFSLTLSKLGFQQMMVTDQASGSPFSSESVLVRGAHFIATGANAGEPPVVKVYDAATGTLLYSFHAFAPGWMGGVRVAVADVNGDGVPDIIVAAGPGGGPEVRVYDGSNFQIIKDFWAYDPSFRGGVYVAAGDVNGDGYTDIITGAGEGGGPHVKVFSGKDGSVLWSFMAYDPAFLGGVRVAAGDVYGVGHADIITGAGPGGGPRVEVFDGVTGALMQSYFAYSPSFSLGVFVAAGDVTGDGRADIITGPSFGGGPEVKVFEGDNPSVILQDFMAFTVGFDGGVRVGYVGPLSNSGPGNILVGAGPSGGPEVALFNGQTLSPVDSFFAFAADYADGIFVGGA